MIAHVRGLNIPDAEGKGSEACLHTRSSTTVRVWKGASVWRESVCSCVSGPKGKTNTHLHTESQRGKIMKMDLTEFCSTEKCVQNPVLTRHIYRKKT